MRAAKTPGSSNGLSIVTSIEAIDDVQILKAFHDCFSGNPQGINYVTFEVQNRGADTLRTTRIMRAGVIERESTPPQFRGRDHEQYIASKPRAGRAGAGQAHCSVLLSFDSADASGVLLASIPISGGRGHERQR